MLLARLKVLPGSARPRLSESEGAPDKRGGPDGSEASFVRGGCDEPSVVELAVVEQHVCVGVGGH